VRLGPVPCVATGSFWIWTGAAIVPEPSWPAYTCSQIAQESNRQRFLLTRGGQQALSLRFCRLQTVLPFTRVLALSVLPRWHLVVGQWYLRPRPFCSPPLALGGWAMMLDCWFLPESPWKKAQHRRRAVSVSVRTAASSWEPSKQSLEPAKAQYSVDEHAPLAMVALWCCAGCFFHQP
jgi:hypothetical protein